MVLVKSLDAVLKKPLSNLYTMKNYGEKAFKSGANATITGNMLTTTGSTVEEDIKLIQKLGRIL